MSLSAAVVVRSEADDLETCLTSLRDLADELVVVDTGLAGTSIAVAERHGAIVVHEPWDGDLSAARNRGLELAGGDWVLSVDADERVRGDAVTARSVLDAADGCVGFRVRFVPRTGWTPSRADRLWRNRADIRVHGTVQELVEPALSAAAAADGLHIAPFDAVTIHAGDRPAARAREEPLLLAELERRPELAFVYDHLARIYEAAGDSDRAVETWERGIAVARTRRHSHPDDRLLYVDLVHHLLTHGHVDDELEHLVGEARAAFDRLPTLELAAARLAFATGRPRDALEPLEWLVDLDDDAIIATGASYDERVFGEWSWSLIGLCRFSLGDDAAAADAFGRAERAAPGDAGYAVRRRLAEARAGTSA